MKIIRDYIFHSLDQSLPRELASLPYKRALESVRLTLTPLGAQVWCRNSFKLGNYVFGVSDLDITVLFPTMPDPRTMRELLVRLQTQKHLYPFLGETNFYFADELGPLLPTLNFFERKRDPEFNERFPADRSVTEAEKLSFLLRMLFSDRVKLKRHPVLRQKKWQTHLRELGFEVPQIVTKNEIDQILLSKLGPQIKSSLVFLEEKNLSDEKIFSAVLPPEWKFLFPNKYLWFDRERSEDFTPALKDPVLRDVCLAQITWEVWGIFSQLPVLIPHKTGLRIHLDRMGRVSEGLGANLVAEQVSVLKRVSEKAIATYRN